MCFYEIDTSGFGFAFPTHHASAKNNIHNFSVEFSTWRSLIKKTIFQPKKVSQWADPHGAHSSYRVPHYPY